MNEREDELAKKQSKINQLMKDLKVQRGDTKEKEGLIFKIVDDINNYVQQKDEKVYVKGLMQLYQEYVLPRQGSLASKKKKDPETKEELDRQIQYMERSIGSIKTKVIKNETRTKNDIKKRTKENTELIQELNTLRKEVRQLKGQIEAQKQKFEQYKFKQEKEKS